MNAKPAPHDVTVTVMIPPTDAAADRMNCVAVAPQNGSLQSAAYIPNAPIAGDLVNSRSLGLQISGPGHDPENAAQLPFTGNLPALTAAPFTVNPLAAGVAAKLGDVIVFRSTHMGTGLADPGGLLVLTFAR